MKNLESLSVGQVLEKSAAGSPDKIAVVDGERRITYKELNATSSALATGLAEIGFTVITALEHLFRHFPNLRKQVDQPCSHRGFELVLFHELSNSFLEVGCLHIETAS